jgi:4'-phosphopantetheinyl transferase
MEIVPPSWEPRSVAPDLSEGFVHIWRVRADTSDAAVWHRLLNSFERERLSRFRCDGDASREAVGRGALRLLLGQYLGLTPHEVTFCAQTPEKPAVSGRQVEFNVSHSGKWVLLAFARKYRVGIDIEQWRAMDIDSVAHDVLTAEEMREWTVWPTSSRVAGFFDAWTLKEAYLKALGTGIFKAPNSVQIRIAFDTLPKVVWCADDPNAPERWRLSRLDMKPGYSAALVAESGIGRILSYSLSV